jgi:hypothetical protein
MNLNGLDLSALMALVKNLAAAAERSAAHPRPDDALMLGLAVSRAAMEFCKTIPGTDWEGIQPVPAMVGAPDRMVAVKAIFRVLKACYKEQPMILPPDWIAAELKAVLPPVTDEANCLAPALDQPSQASGGPSLSDDEYTILLALRDKRPLRMLLEDLAADTSIGRKTCGKAVNSLIERGLVERRSQRSGATITSAGDAIVASANSVR